MYSICYSCPILTKQEFSQQIFEKKFKHKIPWNPSSRSRVAPCRLTNTETYITNLIAAFRSFMIPFKNWTDINERVVVIIFKFQFFYFHFS
jgi:hypothetical protein